MSRPTAEYVRGLFDYNPETGILSWKIQASGITKGNRAGYVRFEKTAYYRYVKIQKQPYREHIIIWLWVTGEWPEHRLDHKDLNGTNNTWANLRPATSSQNVANQTLRSNNTTGYKGVSYSRASGKYTASICANRKTTHLGSFPTAAEASLAYASAARLYFGDYARVK